MINNNKIICSIKASFSRCTMQYMPNPGSLLRLHIYTLLDYRSPLPRETLDEQLK
jgi:hypothetical protein